MMGAEGMLYYINDAYLCASTYAFYSFSWSASSSSSSHQIEMKCVDVGVCLRQPIDFGHPILLIFFGKLYARAWYSICIKFHRLKPHTTAYIPCAYTAIFQQQHQEQQQQQQRDEYKSSAIFRLKTQFCIILFAFFIQNRQQFLFGYRIDNVMFRSQEKMRVFFSLNIEYECFSFEWDSV